MGRKGYRIGRAYLNADGTVEIVVGVTRHKFADISAAVEWCKAEKVDAYICN